MELLPTDFESLSLTSYILKTPFLQRLSGLDDAVPCGSVRGNSGCLGTVWAQFTASDSVSLDCTFRVATWHSGSLTRLNECIGDLAQLCPRRWTIRWARTAVGEMDLWAWRARAQSTRPAEADPIVYGICSKCGRGVSHQIWTSLDQLALPGVTTNGAGLVISASIQ